VYDTRDTDATVPFAELHAAACGAGPLPGESRITFEPGGQVELSTRRADSAGEAIGLASIDAAKLLARLDDAGLAAVALGLDPARPRRRVLDAPRYAAMAGYFAAQGTAGAGMMCSSAALQVNVGLGQGAEAARRWELAHDIGPVLAAMFAHSPLCAGRRSGWRSARLGIWSALDPSRTAPVVREHGRDPRDAWAEYALDARVMFVRLDERRYAPVSEPLRFGEWVEHGHPLGFPTADDLSYHLTTLFPPVRPRGWLELRMLDALPDPLWRVAAAVTATVLTDCSGSCVLPAEIREHWIDAAWHGPGHPVLRDAALSVLDVAIDAMPGTGIDDDTIAAAITFRDDTVARGRCPADDRLDAWAASGALLPAPEPVTELVQ